MKDKEKNVATPSEPQHTPLRSLTPIQQLIRAYKEAKGIDPDNAKWDKLNFSRYLRAGKQLLEVFDGDSVKAIQYMQSKGAEWQELADWGLDAIVRAASRDSSLFNGKSKETETPVVSMREYNIELKKRLNGGL